MNARDVELAGANVSSLGRRVVHSLLVAGGLAATAGAVAPFSTSLAIAVSAGAVFELGRAVVLWFSRRELIERLALQMSRPCRSPSCY